MAGSWPAKATAPRPVPTRAIAIPASGRAHHHGWDDGSRASTTFVKIRHGRKMLTVALERPSICWLGDDSAPNHQTGAEDDDEDARDGEHRGRKNGSERTHHRTSRVLSRGESNCKQPPAAGSKPGGECIIHYPCRFPPDFTATLAAVRRTSTRSEPARGSRGVIVTAVDFRLRLLVVFACTVVFATSQPLRRRASRSRCRRRRARSMTPTGRRTGRRRSTRARSGSDACRTTPPPSTTWRARTLSPETRIRPSTGLAAPPRAGSPGFPSSSPTPTSIPFVIARGTRASARRWPKTRDRKHRGISRNAPRPPRSSLSRRPATTSGIPPRWSSRFTVTATGRGTTRDSGAGLPRSSAPSWPCRRGCNR